MSVWFFDVYDSQTRLIIKREVITAFLYYDAWIKVNSLWGDTNRYFILSAKSGA